MPKILYRRKRFGADSTLVIARSIRVLEEYAAQGFDLTVRQLFYQHVARGWIPNTQKAYKRLSDIVNDARLAGLIDWDHIVDRTRELRSLGHWDDPSSVVAAVAKQFRIDKWEAQPNRVEVWIEKDALVGVIQGVCNRLDVPYFSCRGYTSQSEMWSASQRLGSYLRGGQSVVVLHLGDHDPSGLDMSRDIEERLMLFMATDRYRYLYSEDADQDEAADEALAYVADHFRLDRIALNRDQITQYDPPPNPAKLTDARSRGYIREHGRESWELDALPPDVLAGLIEDAIEALRDDDEWTRARAAEEEHRSLLASAARRWPEIVAFLNGG